MGTFNSSKTFPYFVEDVAPVAQDRPDGGHLPARIGPYTILGVLGEGGMGLVYLAQQAEPFRRQVALKVIKIGMNTREVVARFEAERQALAMMTHSHIAQIYGAGATEDGRPYFVMEHVPGVRITEYCDQNGLSTRARLELFILVCSAVEHAHQKGIIHRDLKPPEATLKNPIKVYKQCPIKGVRLNEVQ